MLALEGAIITLDAMGCQRDIAQAILERQADCVPALKGNQGKLREGVELFAQSHKSRDFAQTKGTRHQGAEGDHGRIETRTTTVFHDVHWLEKRHDWPGLKSLVMVQRVREIGGRIGRESRDVASSLRVPAGQMGALVRGHRTVENSLHRVPDMVFRDDECRVRTAHAPANFTTIKHMALNLLRRAKDKLSIRARRKVAAWDDDFLAGLPTVQARQCINIDEIGSLQPIALVMSGFRGIRCQGGAGRSP